MAEQDKDRNLDHLLDALLASYSDVQPRPGLETKVVAQLREHASQKRAWLWPWNWVWAGAATAALATLIFIVRLERPVEPPQPLVIHADWSLLHQPGSAVEQTPQVVKRTVQPHHREMVVVAADTRPDVFPTPAPLSDQEKLLLRYLARTARHEIVAQSHPDEPVETAEPFLLQIQAPTRTEFNNSTR